MAAKLTLTHSYYGLNITCRPVFVRGRMDRYKKIVVTKDKHHTVLAWADPSKRDGIATLTNSSYMKRAKAYGRVENENVYASFVRVAIKPTFYVDADEYGCRIEYYLGKKTYEVIDNQTTKVNSKRKPSSFTSGCKPCVLLKNK